MAVQVLLEIRPGPGPARDWVREELSRREYQPSLLSRVVGWFFDRVNSLLDAAAGLGRLSPWLAAVVLAALLVLAAVVLARLRPRVADAGPETGPVLGDRRVSAGEHRRRAATACGEDRYDAVVVEALRAITEGLVERAVTDERPGATAREVVADASSAFPAQQDDLHRAADLFDAVMYGDRRADRAGAERLLTLEDELRHARPATTDATGPVPAVPR